MRWGNWADCGTCRWTDFDSSWTSSSSAARPKTLSGQWLDSFKRIYVKRCLNITAQSFVEGEIELANKTVVLPVLPQVPAAAAEEGSALLPDEAHRGGECRQREDRPDPAADEAQALTVELEAGRRRH